MRETRYLTFVPIPAFLSDLPGTEANLRTYQSRLLVDELTNYERSVEILACMMYLVCLGVVILLLSLLLYTMIRLLSEDSNQPVYSNLA